MEICVLLSGAPYVSAWNLYDKYLAPTTLVFSAILPYEWSVIIWNVGEVLATDSFFLKFPFKSHFWENVILKYLMMSQQVANKWVDTDYHRIAMVGKSLQRSSSLLKAESTLLSSCFSNNSEDGDFTVLSGQILPVFSHCHGIIFSYD